MAEAAVRTKRIAAPVEAAADGTRILVARYRPRGVCRGNETWAEWEKRVAPSVPLVDLFYGKRRARGKPVERGLAPIGWDDYVQRYEEEMRAPAARAAIGELARRTLAGETITLLCYCEDETRCHRTLLRKMIEREMTGARKRGKLR